MSSHVLLDCMLAMKGYFSTRQPNCFVWEEGYFEKGSQVIFGTSGKLGRILGVCGVGRNFFMLRVKELGGFLDGEVTVQRMVVLFPPSGGFQLGGVGHCFTWQGYSSLRETGFSTYSGRQKYCTQLSHVTLHILVRN